MLLKPVPISRSRYVMGRELAFRGDYYDTYRDGLIAKPPTVYKKLPNGASHVQKN